MPSLKIIDLAKVMCDSLPIEYTGIPKGEKLHEILMTEDEADFAYTNKDMIVICPNKLVEYYRNIGFCKVEKKEYSSKNYLLSKQQIGEMIRDYYENQCNISYK